MGIKKGSLGIHTFIFSALLFTLSTSALANENRPSAGQVLVNSGTLKDLHPDKTVSLLARGDNFYSGDILSTAKSNTAQIRFTDGTVMALNEKTQIKIDRYEFTKNPKTDKSWVTLVKGGFRALTGLISKQNASAYEVKTPVAIIGVRGTNYGAVLDKGKLYTGVWKGGVVVKNDKVLINLGLSSDYAFAEVSENQAPVGLLNPPPQLIGGCQIA